MAEKQYIEKRKLIEAWERERTDATDLFDAFDFALENVPAADVVEVVRCKDCKHSVKYTCRNDACFSFTICRLRDSYSVGVEEDDFCSYGERKEDTL